MNCPKCGVTTVADAVFCQKCGAKLAGETASAASTAEATPTRGGRQVVDTPEQNLWEGHYSPRAMIGTWITLGVLNSIMLFAGIYLLAFTSHKPYGWVLIAGGVLLDFFMMLRYVVKRYTNRYRLTNHRFFHESGILTRVVNPIDLITINDVAFEQGLVQRLMNVGTIRIMSTDTTDPEMLVEGIEDVQNIATLIDKTRREETMRRRVFYDATPHG